MDVALLGCVRHAWRWKILWRRIEVVKSDGLVWWIFDDEGSEEWRLAVCHVSIDMDRWRWDRDRRWDRRLDVGYSPSGWK